MKSILGATLSMAFLIVLLSFKTQANSVFPPVSELPSQIALPDPLVMFNGKPVKTKKDWFNKRRPELKELFQHYMYGYFPPAPKIKSTVELVDKNLFGGKATLKLVTISLGPTSAPKIHLLLAIPNKRTQAAPVFLGLNFRGNHTLLTNTNIPLTENWLPERFPDVKNNCATDAMRGAHGDTWAIEQSIDRGYAVASFNCGDIDPDKPDFTDGVHPFFHSDKSMKPDTAGQRGNDEWGTIAAWAWGASRAVDYLVADHDLDKTRIAVVGHSRLGKTALLAGAFDERIALVIPLQAGCGGTAPSRLPHDDMAKKYEGVKGINKQFPHWFCNEFKKFGEQPEKLPFDQHLLIALCAPRPVLVCAATGDTWSNPKGQFEMVKAADQVYRFVGAQGLATDKMPEPEVLVDSDLSYYIRPGKHSMTTGDWKVFLDFADKHFEKDK